VRCRSTLLPTGEHVLVATQRLESTGKDRASDS
jgi:hypothetical protein